MIIGGKIVVSCDLEYHGSYYYFDTEKCLWFGDIKSQIKVVKRKVPRPDYMQKILTKIAVKMGYPKEIFKVRKVVHTHTVSKPKPAKAKTTPKKQSSTFISLF